LEQDEQTGIALIALLRTLEALFLGANISPAESSRDGMVVFLPPFSVWPFMSKLLSQFFNRGYERIKPQIDHIFPAPPSPGAKYKFPGTDSASTAYSGLA